jgi:hypothetical protein
MTYLSLIFAWEPLYEFFSGSAYVDLNGLTGYNTGTYYEGERCVNMLQFMTPLYAEYKSASLCFSDYRVWQQLRGRRQSALAAGHVCPRIDYPRIKPLSSSVLGFDSTNSRPASTDHETRLFYDTVKQGLAR